MLRSCQSRCNTLAILVARRRSIDSVHRIHHRHLSECHYSNDRSSNSSIINNNIHSKNVMSHSRQRSKPNTRRRNNSSHLLASASALSSYSLEAASSSFSSLASQSSSSSSSVSSSLSETAADSVESSGGGDDVGGGLLRLLTEEEREILAEQRALVARARQLARYVGVPAVVFESSSSSSKSSCILPDASFCVVVIGEFNSGKSTLINALLGNSKLLPMGSLPTTERLTVLTSTSASHSVTQTTTATDTDDSGVEYIPVDNSLLLQDLTLVDTPGTNALFRHTRETTQILPHADWIVFVTSAERPLPESEQLLLQKIAQYQKSIVVVVNKMDILHASGGDHGAAEKQRVLDYVQRHAARILFNNNTNSNEHDSSSSHHDEQPNNNNKLVTVLAVSARDALAAKVLQSQGGVWTRSNFAELEQFLAQTLTTQTKIQSKLASPLGVVEASMNECLKLLQAEQQELEVDNVTLRLLQAQIDGWRSELETELKLARRDMLRVLEQQGHRCHVLWRRSSWMDLIETMVLDRNLLQREWDRTLDTVLPRGYHVDDAYDSSGNTTTTSASTTRLVLEHMIRETADSIAIRGRAQGQATIEFLGKRPSVRRQPLSLVGSVTAAGRFEETRQSLSQQMSQAARLIIPGKRDEDSESALLLDQLQSAGRMAVVAAVGSVAAASALAVATDPAVVSGLAAACGLVAVTGATWSSVQWQAVRDHQQRWISRSRDLESALEQIANKEVERMERKVQEGVNPYRQLIESEGTRIRKLSGECQSVIQTAQELRSRIENLQPRSSS